MSALMERFGVGIVLYTWKYAVQRPCGPRQRRYGWVFVMSISSSCKYMCIADTTTLTTKLHLMLPLAT